MSTPPPPAKDRPDAAKNGEQRGSSGPCWRSAFAVFMFVYSGKVEPEKKNFYLIAGGIGAVAAAINGYNAWTLHQKTKQPPSK